MSAAPFSPRLTPLPGLDAPPGWSEQDPEDWWTATEGCSPSSMAAGADGIGLTGQMHGLVALDPIAGRCARRSCGTTAEPAAGVPDRTASGNRAARRAEREPGAGGLHGAQARLAGRDEPDVHRRIERVRCPRTTCASDSPASSPPTSPTRRDAAAGRGPPPVERGADRGIRGRSTVAAGRVRVAGDHWTDGGGAPIAAGGGDQAAGALGVGVTDDGSPASLALGTSGVIFAARKPTPRTLRGALHAFCHALPDTWHVMGVILAAAGALGWLARRAPGRR